VLLTFIAKDMRLLRATAIFSNVAFITYGAIVWLPPVLLLHLVPLLLNIVRLSEAISTGTIRARTVSTTAHLCIRLRYPLLEQRSLARHNQTAWLS
jgi:hypothetical protein